MKLIITIDLLTISMVHCQHVSHHYGNPFKKFCQSGEIAIGEHASQACSSICSNSACPTDSPAGFKGNVECYKPSRYYINRFCILRCRTDNDCPAGAGCHKIKNELSENGPTFSRNRTLQVASTKACLWNKDGANDLPSQSEAVMESSQAQIKQDDPTNCHDSFHKLIDDAKVKIHHIHLLPDLLHELKDVFELCRTEVHGTPCGDKLDDAKEEIEKIVIHHHFWDLISAGKKFHEAYEECKVHI